MVKKKYEKPELVRFARGFAAGATCLTSGSAFYTCAAGPSPKVPDCYNSGSNGLGG